jgi:peptidoglycan-associated lipoprotein
MNLHRFSIKYIVYFLLSCLVFFSGCQTAQKAYKKGVTKQQQGEYNYSTEYFKLSMQLGGNKGRLNYLIAENFRVTNRLPEALKYYEAAINAGTKEEKASYYFAQALKTQGRYVDAKINFEKYAKNGLNKTLAKMARAEADFIANIDALRNKETFYQVRNMGNDINSDGPEYAPLYREGQLIYTASNNQFEYTAIGSGFTDLYVFKFDGIDDNTGVKKEFGEKINKNKTHEACAAVSPDAGMVIYAKSNDGKRKGAVDTDLYFTELRDEVWSEPAVLTPVSDPRSWESCPALSPDGKTLYFASNRKGGYGGIDLYKSVLTDTAGWSAPVNMGSKINTAGNDMFPSVRKDGRFYFASDGHPGLGALDIFAVITDTTGTTGEMIKIENLGLGINTASDDFGITYKDKTAGYFASNRPGGKGDDDIYEFRVVIPPAAPIIKYTKSYLAVYVFDPTIKEENKQGIDSAIVTLKTDSLSPGITMNTDSMGIALLPIDTNVTYTILAERSNYFSNTGSFISIDSPFKKDSISPVLINRYYNTKLDLQKIQIGREIILEHIYYDYNKADIRHDAEPDLQLLIDFLKKNPGVTIELGSHTDSRGNDAYNLKLSKARAQSAVDYIVRNGIGSERIKPVGYGETRHKIPEALTEEEHQVNRRTEFKIVDVKN